MIVANKKFVVKLSSEERKRLSELISKGKSVSTITHIDGASATSFDGWC
jgi:hypothetical protein